MPPIKALLVVLAVCLLAANTSAAFISCCRKYTNGKMPFSAIRGYTVQTETEFCPLNAIIFHTKKGKACTNPALPWVMGYINRLRAKAQMVHDKTALVN